MEKQRIAGITLERKTFMNLLLLHPTLTDVVKLYPAASTFPERARHSGGTEIPA